MEKIKVLIADDHRVVREGSRRSSRPKRTSTWSAKRRTVQEAVEKAKTLMPDVILMDVSMPRWAASKPLGDQARISSYRDCCADNV